MKLRKLGLGGAATLAIMTMAASADAQLRDITQISPTPPGGAIQKSLSQQIGAGRGDIMTPGTSAFIIARDPFRAVRRGRQIFQRKFNLSQGLGPTTNDGIGNPSFVGGDPSITAGLADSCAACHGRPRGSAGFGGDVVTRPDSRDAPHLFGLGLQEQLGDEMTGTLRQIRADAITQAADTGAPATLPLIAKTVNYGSITANPDGTVNTAGVVGVDPDLRVRPFFAQGLTMSIREFLVGAFNAEMGLESPDPDLRAAAINRQRVMTPSGMVLDGAQDIIEGPQASSTSSDDDNDGHVNEIPTSIVDFMEFYLLNYFKAGTSEITPEVTMGRATFTSIGCASCHKPTFTIASDRRVADLETVFSAPTTTLNVGGNPINRLFATGTPFILGGFPAGVNDGSGLPSLKAPARGSFVVRNFFADFKRHDIGVNFHERNYEGTLSTLFITEPLWGVGTTPTYGHDGRSGSLEDVILRHGGEAQVSRDAFNALTRAAKNFVLQFLGSLVLFAPDDTASNLQPVNQAAPNYPQNGHGAIALVPLFNNTAELE